MKDKKKDIQKDIRRVNNKIALAETDPRAYHEMIREKGYRLMEKDSGEKVQRFRSKEGSAALHRLNSAAAKEFSRREIK